MTDRVLVIGRGASEQIVSLKLAQSAHVKQVLVAPGSANTADSTKICNSVSNPSILKQFCKDHNIGLVIVNPVSLLITGLIDELNDAGVKCFGPNVKASQLEASKHLAKDFMDRHGIPTARWKSFTNPHEACRFITYSDFPALVVKPSKSTSAKDFYKANDKDEACRAVQQLTQVTLVIVHIENLRRVSHFSLQCLAFTDGTLLAPKPLVKIQTSSAGLSQDSQTADTGAACPANTVKYDVSTHHRWHFVGVLNTISAQVVLPLLQSDLYEVVQAAIDGRLGACLPVWAHGKYKQHTEYSERNKIKSSLCKGLLQTLTEYGVCASHRMSTPIAMYCFICGFLLAGQLGAPRKHAGYLEVDVLYIFSATHLHLCHCFTWFQVAQSCDQHNLVARDLVAACMNDLVSQGAEPLYFVPHFTCGKLPVATSQAITDELTSACKTAGKTILEREVKQDLDLYHEGCYHLTGFAVGVVERKSRLPRSDKMAEGDVIIGVRSLGVHSSSFGIIRRIMEKHSLRYSSTLPVEDEDNTWGEMLLRSTKMYSATLSQALQSGHVRACVPVAEGGLKGSILKALPQNLGFIIDVLCWKIPAILSWLYKEGGLLEEDIISNFSCGLGVVMIVQKNMAEQMLLELQKQEEAWLIGALIQHHSSRAHVCHLLDALKVNTLQLLKNIPVSSKPNFTRNAAVFLCTTGTKLQLLIDSTRKSGNWARVALVISTQAAVEELKKAAGVGIPTRVIDPMFFGCHADFELTISKVLEEFSVDLICYVGFRRTMSAQFLTKWKGKKVNKMGKTSQSEILCARRIMIRRHRQWVYSQTTVFLCIMCISDFQTWLI
uniref:phosphoribosylformylglycinamidine cyclo-ligase n=1 Tax=Leptobrachium leishanense TaxID=445787 RepID=A0A8C5MN73_9ANUR